MNSIPQQQLCNVIARYGETMYCSPDRCEALLRDLCGTQGVYTKEIFLIRLTHDQGIVRELLDVKNRRCSYEAVKAKWLATLGRDYSIAEDAACWTVETWAKALGVSSNAEGKAGEVKLSQTQLWAVTSITAILLSLAGGSMFMGEQAKREEAQRKATIAEAYNKLICDEPPIDLTLNTKEPNYIYANGTRFYGPTFLTPILSSRSRGTMIFKSGDRYDGEFSNNKRNGCGTYTYVDGTVYTGQLENDRFNGIGLLNMTDQSRYIGEFKNGNCHGEGILINKDGQVRKGTWQKNTLQGTTLYCRLP